MSSGMVLVTGATGFVGGAVVRQLLKDRVPVRAALRSTASSCLPTEVQLAKNVDITTDFDWSSALKDCDAVVHAAARVHIMRDPAIDPLAAYRRTNVGGTINLAKQAAALGVRRFVFVSSIKVNGERTTAGNPFREDSVPAPIDAYGRSKYEAECALQALAAVTSMELVIIRPPLVYGPRVKANFLKLMQLVHSGIPLPFGAIDNRRTFVGLQNLAHLIATCLREPSAAGQLFLAGDGEDMSTSDLLRRIGLALNRPARLIAIPQKLLTACATLVGKREAAHRILGSLQVDISKARTILAWQPPITVDEGLEFAAAAFLRDLDRSRSAPP
jgi:nucleoside-diphosphate-sugar epimerase